MHGSLISPTGVSVKEFEANSLTNVTLPETGTYVIRVAANDLVSTGAYNIGLEALMPLGPVDAALTNGGLVSRTISAKGQVDLITYNGQKNAGVLLSLVVTSGFSSRTVHGSLVSPTGVSVKEFDANSLTDLTLPETGTYVIRVAANDLVSTGAYNIGLEALMPLGPVDATLTNGALISRAISAPGQVDLITYNGQKDAAVSLSLVLTSGFSSRTVHATLFSPTGVRVKDFDANSLTNLTLPETGAYVILLTANDLVSTGSYNLGATLR